MGDVSADSIQEVRVERHARDVEQIALFISRHFDRASTPEQLVAGLPLDNNVLDFASLPRALQRLDLLCTPISSPVGKIADYDMPAILKRADDTIFLLIERREDGNYLTYDPHIDGKQTLTPEELGTDTKVGLSVRPTNVSDKQKQQKHWLTHALANQKRAIFHIILGTIFINIFAIAMSLFTLNVYDRVLPNKALSTLWVLAIGLGIVFIFDLLLKIARGALIDEASRTIDFRLSSVLFDRVMNSQISDRPSSTGAFAAKISQYEVLREFFASSTIVMFIDVLFLGFFAFIVSLLVGWVVIFPLIASALAILVTIIIGLRAGKYVRAAMAEISSKNAVLFETLGAVQTVKAARAEGHFLRKWENTVLISSQTQNKVRALQSTAIYFTALMGQVALVSIIIAGTYRFAAAEVSMGAIIASMMLSNRIIAPVSQISTAILKTRGAFEAFKSLGELMSLKDERHQDHRFIQRTVGQGRIEFDKVRFAYPQSNRFVLDQVSFKIAEGEKVGVIGRIGAGKSTLGRLLLKFYEPTEGSILVDGISISQYHPAHLRKNIGLVLQDPELFDGTVRENIMLGAPEATDEELLEAARKSGVERFVALHPLGFDMPVGERGSLISGGQRQAIALARTLLANPKVLFLDEPSSSMDMVTERELVQHLRESLKPDHTVIIATHRQSLLSLVDRLLVIDNGRLVADGPRDKVLAQLKSNGAST
ncbi:ATP-binding cassette subfamily C protein LapB [Maritalea mobilis]|uniref:ATP-binding cassette subfamily C protein LapB n=1 Tax=Maritalea mobilis TaxID=483324 RepID=A0A4R6VN02_9HYPH|nr:type I secretion system permease/ATPase [Maritalea mobilis]TDQ63553.1 ATP-binding cassette subfamily C protein LapB [Maritalea mobilis]